MLTSYNNKWLGDPSFDPIFEELDRRRAVVFVHPTNAPCCSSLLAGVPDSAIEYGTDTTRAIAQYVFSGRSLRFKNVRIIWSHGGGTMPFLNERFVHLADREPKYQQLLPGGFLPQARQFYYDTAQVSNTATLAALSRIVPASHVLFGTDYPYLSIEENVAGLDQAGIYSARDLAAIDAGNAAALLG